MARARELAEFETARKSEHDQYEADDASSEHREREDENRGVALECDESSGKTHKQHEADFEAA